MNALTLYRNATKRLQHHQKGFTLIELLVVIGILAVLLAIVLIAINPAKQFSQANDTKRSSDVNALLNAIHQYSADNRGDITALGIATGTAETLNDTNNSTFCETLVTEYIAALPADPTAGDSDIIDDAKCTAGGWNTGYTVVQSASDNRITVSAPATENGDPIAVTR